VVLGLARHFGLASVQVAKKPARDGSSWGSLWILLTRNPDFLASPGVADENAPHESAGLQFPLWTDDHSSLLPLLKSSAWDPEGLRQRGDERGR
jgi:hypothetical protein